MLGSEERGSDCADTRRQELHKIEEELNVEILPGTEVMADVGSHHFVKSGSGVLVPQPSEDKNDPLVNKHPPVMLQIC